MADYKQVFVAHFETSPRHKGCSTWGKKEFNTKWEAEKFLHEYQQNHWYASTSGWVSSEVIDLRSEAQKAYDERVQERVANYISRNWSRFRP